jgi:N-acetyl sugar amidotransferase
MKNAPLYNLPPEVKFCTECVISNQRPLSYPEFKHTKDRKGAKYINFDKNGVCDACNHAKEKKKIDWEDREKKLLKLLEKYRSSNNSYDCIVPGSGGKDSAYQSHILKNKYGMNPLTITWSPIAYTEYGYENWKNWVEIGGCDNILIKPSGKVMKKLTKLSIENLLHPFQTFFYGQKNLIPKIAAKFKIPLVFYGENEAEYGNPIADNSLSLRDKSYWSIDNLKDIYLGGVSLKELNDVHNISLRELYNFIPAIDKEFEDLDLQIHYLGYYLRWTPQETYYYAVKNTGFKARPYRTQGTYSKYNSIDDKIDDLHYYTTGIKFGIGRATYDASQEIRNNHITRDEGKALVAKFDHEFPDKYFSELMKYLDLDTEYFHKLCDDFRSDHLWKKVNNEWKLRHNVNMTGTDD